MVHFPLNIDVCSLTDQYFLMKSWNKIGSALTINITILNLSPTL